MSLAQTRKRGTFIRLRQIQKSLKKQLDFSFDTLSARLRELAFLNKNSRITIEDKRTNKSHEFFFEGGIVSFVQHINAKKEPFFRKSHL